MNNTREKYQTYLSENYERIKLLLFNCFVEFYGIEYFDIIKEAFENTEIVFYINPKRKMPSIRKLSSQKNTPSKYYDQITEDYKKIKKEMNKNGYSKILFSSKEVDKSFFELIDNAIENNLTCEISHIDDNKEFKRYICIPLFFANDKCLIHEFIHAISSQLLLIIERNDKIVPIFKTGLIVSQIPNSRFLEEGITEIESQKMYELFLKKCDSFLDLIYHAEKYGCSYDILKPLIIPFYEEFKDYITYSRITLNMNFIVNICDKTSYLSFSNIINECYKDFPENQDFVDYLLLSRHYLNKMKEKSRCLRLQK